MLNQDGTKQSRLESISLLLIKCKACGKEISNQAISCPSCGHPITPEIKPILSRQYSLWQPKIIIGIVGVFIILGIIISSLEAPVPPPSTVSKKGSGMLESSYIIRKALINNPTVLVSVIPELRNLDETLGNNRTQEQELKYLTAVIEERINNFWTIDAENHRYLIHPALWKWMPLKQKEHLLWIIYEEENTWWDIYDIYSGQLLGKVSSLGVTIN